jgi:hypothetical protein
MRRRELAAEVAKDLWAAEAAIDEALSRTAALMGRLPKFRIEARISAVVGQGAFDRASETIAMLTSARRQIVETHHELHKSQLELRIPTSAIGPGDTKPDTTGTGTGFIQIVSPARAA